MFQEQKHGNTCGIMSLKLQRYVTRPQRTSWPSATSRAIKFKRQLNKAIGDEDIAARVKIMTSTNAEVQEALNEAIEGYRGQAE